LVSHGFSNVGASFWGSHLWSSGGGVTTRENFWHGPPNIKGLMMYHFALIFSGISNVGASTLLGSQLRGLVGKATPGVMAEIYFHIL